MKAKGKDKEEANEKPFALALFLLLAATLLLAFLPLPALAETQTIILSNVPNSFPMFSNAEYAKFTIGNDTITLTLDSNASFDGVCNLSNLTGTNISAAGSSAELNYSSVTYQTGTYDQKWESAPYFNDTENRLYLLSGSGIITALNLAIKENVTDKTIPKVVGVGDLVGQFQIQTVAQGKNSTYNELKSSIEGTGYADLYVQYAPDTSYENTPFIPTFSHCEKLQEMMNSNINGSESTVVYQVDVLGVANGTEPISGVSHDWELSLELDVEYFPTSYQTGEYDQKWGVFPYFNDTENRLYLLSGSGIMTKLNLAMKENVTDKTIPKVVGVGDLVGQFQIQTVAQGKNSTDNKLDSMMKGVGYADLYVQYAPDTSYENTPFIPTFSHCEKLQEMMNSVISGSESTVLYQVDVLGVANGTEPISGVSHDWELSLELDVEYFPTSYQTGEYDQKWGVFPYFNDTENRLYLLSGSGIMTKLNLEMKENVTDKTIPKVVGVGDLVGQFQIQTFAQGKNSTDNELDSMMNGVGYADLYVQYAPDTSYENTTFIPTFAQCEKLQLNTQSDSSVVMCAANMLGISTGAECLMFNNMPLDNVAIDEAFDLEYHPVNISCDMFDECWSVKPVQYDDILVILRGTGTITGLNFIFNDSTAAHPEIRFYGYLMGDYNIAANILPHYMDVLVAGPDVAAMNYVEQGGFGVNFGEGPNCACGDICVNETGWWRDDNITFYPSDMPIQAAIDNATVGDTICVKDGTYNENVDVDKQLTIISETGADSSIVSALDPNDHVFDVTADYVNLCGFSVQDATDKTGIYLGSGVDHCSISDNNVKNNKYGIYLNYSSNNTIRDSNVSDNEIDGIYLHDSHDNTIANNTVLNNTAWDSGIHLQSSNRNKIRYNNASFNSMGIALTSSSNNTLTKNTASNNNDDGIRLVGSSNNNIEGGNVSHNSGGIYIVGVLSHNNITGVTITHNNNYGIKLQFEHYCTIANNIIRDNTEYGIYLDDSSHNTLTNNTASNNTNYDFYSNQNSHNNTVEDFTISSFPTTISFTYDNGIGIKGVTTPEPDPAGKVNIRKYVNATNVTADSWMFMNVSYEDGDLGGVDENSLRMWKHNGTAWTEVPGTNGVNTAEKYVYANITEFSVFAPLGTLSPKLCTTPDSPSHDFGIVPPGKTRNWDFEITNCGDPGSTLNWNVTADKPWISVSPSSGTNTTVTVTIDTKLPDGGVKTGTIIVNSNGGTKTGVIRVNIELETAPETGYATFATTDGYFDSVKAVAEGTLPAEGKPAGMTFPHGFFSFNIEGLAINQSVTVTIVLPSDLPANAEYWKYGPTPDNPTDHWYKFMYDGQTGAEINGDLVTLHFVDGLRGDDNPTPDGKIIDQGAPGSPPIPVPEFNAVGLLALVGILSVVLAVTMLRRRKE